MALFAGVAQFVAIEADSQVVQTYVFPAGGGSPLAIAADGRGGAWYTIPRPARIGHLSRQGSRTEYAVPGTFNEPRGIAADADGNGWFVDVKARAIGRVTPAGEITMFTGPTADPTGKIFAGPDGGLWFPSAPGHVGRISTTGTFGDVVFSRTGFPNAGDLTWDSDGSLWLNEEGGKAIVRVAADSTTTRYEVPAAIGSGAAGLAHGAPGKIWFSVRSFGGVNPNNPPLLGLLTKEGVFSFFDLPSDVGFSIAAGPDGNVWLVGANDRLIRVSPAGLVIGEVIVASRRSSFQPSSLSSDPAGALWYTQPNFIDDGSYPSGAGRVDLGQGTGPAAELVIPTLASLPREGVSFTSALWLMNMSPGDRVPVTLRYRAFNGQTRAPADRIVTLEPRESRPFADALLSIFHVRGAGSLEILYPFASGPVTATTRVTSLNRAPAFSFAQASSSLSASPLESAGTRTLFFGLSRYPYSVATGYGQRCNAGAFNPNDTAVHVAFTLLAADGSVIGSVTRQWEAREGFQFSTDIFTAAGADSVTADDATLVVESDRPVFPYAIVIENQSGAPTFLPPVPDVSPR